MVLTIDVHDGAGARDVTALLDASGTAKITRKLNQPEQFTFSLFAESASFVVPTSGSRVVLTRGDGHKLFTGYISAAPTHEYLGWGASAPIFRYGFVAESDEWLLDHKRFARTLSRCERSAGGILQELAEALLPGAFDYSAVQAIETVPFFETPGAGPWSAAA